MSRNVLKFGVGGVALVAVAVGVLFLAGYLRYRMSPEYRTERALEELERRYAEDPYGGSTPEETLQLFIDALKKGDIELASKYFTLEKQEEWQNDLRSLVINGVLDETVADLARLKISKITKEKAFFILADENNMAISQMIMYKNYQNGRWKIGEF